MWHGGEAKAARDRVIGLEPDDPPGAHSISGVPLMRTLIFLIAATVLGLPAQAADLNRPVEKFIDGFARPQTAGFAQTAQKVTVGGECCVLWRQRIGKGGVQSHLCRNDQGLFANPFSQIWAAAGGRQGKPSGLSARSACDRAAADSQDLCGGQTTPQEARRRLPARASRCRG